METEQKWSISSFFKPLSCSLLLFLRIYAFPESYIYRIVCFCLQWRVFVFSAGQTSAQNFTDIRHGVGWTHGSGLHSYMNVQRSTTDFEEANPRIASLITYDDFWVFLPQYIHWQISCVCRSSFRSRLFATLCCTVPKDTTVTFRYYHICGTTND